MVAEELEATAVTLVGGFGGPIGVTAAVVTGVELPI